MGWIVASSLLFGLVGLIAVPVVVFFVVLLLGHALDPRCGTPGDSGGCEVGAVSLALASAIPGLALFFLVALLRGLRSRSKPNANP